jgi:hypothetical protein
MADQDTVRVQMPDGKQWDIPRANLSKAKARGATEVEGTLTKIGRGATLGAFSGAGIPETMHPIESMVSGVGEQAKTVFRPWWHPTRETMKESVLANPVAAVPLALAKGGAEVTEDINPVVDNLFRWLVNVTGGQHGAGGRKLGYVPVEVEKASHDIAQLVTQVALLKGGKEAAETPLSEGTVARGAERGRQVLQQAIVSKAEVENARLAHEAEIKSINDAYEKKVQETGQKTAADEAARRAKIEQAKDKYAAQLAEHTDKVRQASQKQVAGEAKKKTFTQPRSGPVYQRLASMADRVATEYLPKLDKAVRAAYNARWGAWRQAMGDAQGDFTPVMQAVEDAEDTILKGSRENIGIFRSILSEGEDPLLADATVFRNPGAGIDVKAIRGMSEKTRSAISRYLEDLGGRPEAGRMPLEETSLPIDEIRGYVTELQQKMFTGKFVGDIWRALDHVRRVAEEEVQKVAKDRGQLDVYKRLKADWSQYMQDFYDADGALTKLKNSGTSDGRLNLLSGSEGQNIVSALGRYSRLLTKDASGLTAIDLTGKVRSIMHQLREASAAARIPEAPERPQFPPRKPPRAMPERPETQPFSPEGIRRERIQKTAENLSRITGWDVASVGYALRELFTGQTPWALGYPVGKRVLSRLLSNPRVVEYLVREATD